MDSAQIRVLEQMYQECFGCLLYGLDGLTLPPQFSAHAAGEKILGYLAHKTGEGEF
jgi:hypothetical protein